jgi:branched-chain amino acid aminotransferase
MIIYNGNYIEAESGILKSSDHSYRYGDGLFETLKVADGNLLLKEYHFDRLLNGLKILKFTPPSLFTLQTIEKEIVALCSRNNCEKLAKVRLSVSRGHGGLYDCDNNFSYLIECWPLEQKGLNENGLIIDIFPDARKSIDIFSNLKSANYLPYVMAAVWARENKLNDALILNGNERICDSTIANVFWVKHDKIFTPPLNEGCVAGVMRRNILDFGFQVDESVLTENILLEADEVFLTNSTSGIRWVGQFRSKKYINKVASKLFAAIAKTIPA